MPTQGVNNLDWEEGYPGKGIIDTNGGVHTWVDGLDYDFHHDYAGLHGIIAEHYLYINPDGSVEDPVTNRDLSKVEDHLQTADPRLRVVHPQWGF